MRSSRTAALVLAIALLGGAAAGCSNDSDGKPANKASDKKSTKGGAKVAPLGAASVKIGDKDYDFSLTTCVAQAKRLTFQGNDGKGRTLVGSFSQSEKNGSLTVADKSNSWVAGPAGGEKLAKLAVGAKKVTGSGTFAVQAYGKIDPKTGNKPVNASGERETGTFEATCSKTTSPPPPADNKSEKEAGGG